MRIESGQVKKGEKGVKDPKLIRSITGMEESDGAERERWTSNKQTLKAKKKKVEIFSGTALVIGQSARLEIMRRTRLAGANRGEDAVESRHGGTRSPGRQ